MKPIVHINVAMTADGKIDTIERAGAVISSAADKQRVERLRAESDAVMVGGRTLLGEDPRLTVRSEALRLARVGRGLPANPAKVGVVTTAALKPGARFLHEGPASVLIFTTSQTSAEQLEMLRDSGAQVFVNGGPRVDLEAVLETLGAQGVRRLMVEGGGTLNFELLRHGLADELSICIAPLIFGGASAPTPADGIGLTRDAAVALELRQMDRLEDGSVVLNYKVMARDR